MTAFAIIIPNFNQSHFLPTALESLSCQRASCKLAIMDGGSTDNFGEVIKTYSDNIAYLRSAPDNGQSDAIRAGLNEIPGDIVAWLNADDFYFPNTFEKVTKCFETNPDLDVVYGDAIHVNSDGIFLSYFPHAQEFSPKKIKKTNFICQPACFVRRTAYERVGGVNPNLHYTMDWDLWCRLANCGAKFYYLHEVLAAVRYYPGTKTLSRNWKRYTEIWRIERKYGRRLFPQAWAGAYLVDLSFQERKNLVDKYVFALLNHLRQLKKRLFKENDLENNSIKTSYGFHPWDSVVEGQGIIHIPWYGNKEWTSLVLKVDPASDRYRLKINGRECEKVLYKNNHLVVDLPKLENPHREISIECLQSNQWKLLELFWEV